MGVTDLFKKKRPKDEFVIEDEEMAIHELEKIEDAFHVECPIEKRDLAIWYIKKGRLYCEDDGMTVVYRLSAPMKRGSETPIHELRFQELDLNQLEQIESVAAVKGTKNGDFTMDMSMEYKRLRRMIFVCCSVDMGFAPKKQDVDGLMLVKDFLL